MTTEKRAAYITLLVLLVLYAAGCVIQQLYENSSPLQADSPQADYRNFSEAKEINKRSPIFWAELGKDGILSSDVIKNPAISLKTLDFTPGAPWARNVYWSIRATNSGSLTVSFPPHSEQNPAPSHLAVYMTDGDSLSRISLLRKPEVKWIVDDLHNGRWIFLKLTSDERTRGEANILFSKLSGADIALSAVAVFNVYAPTN